MLNVKQYRAICLSYYTAHKYKQNILNSDVIIDRLNWA